MKNCLPKECKNCPYKTAKVRKDVMIDTQEKESENLNNSQQSKKMEDPFYALIMTAMRQADNENLEKLKSYWPKVYEELVCRTTK